MTICYRRVKFRKQREKESSGSARVIASNEDLLMELLLRLPMKSLLKFKCVSKHWLSLISQPHFVCRRNLKSKAVSALYLDCYSYSRRDTKRRYYEFVPLHPLQTFATLEYHNFADSPGLIDVEQSCNGLLFCYSLQEKYYFVSNPSTKQFKALPPLPPGRGGVDMHVLGANLAFDPSISHFYKVVCFLGRKYDDDDGFQILIYSSETGHWRVSAAPFTPAFMVEFRAGVYCNGAIHWTSETDASLYFDLREEVVREMPMPFPQDDRAERRRYFGESGGHLHLLDSYEYLTTHLNVYEMEQDRSGWFLKFRVGPDVLDQFSSDLISVLYVVRGEEEKESFLVVYTTNNKVIRYNFISQTIQEICDFDSLAIYVTPPAYQYIESLSIV